MLRFVLELGLGLMLWLGLETSISNLLGSDYGQGKFMVIVRALVRLGL